MFRKKSSQKKYKRVITFGTFDLLHIGHIEIFRRAKELGEYLVVGVSSDELNARKGKHSYFNQTHRMNYISALKYVDEVFLEESLELKDHYIKQHDAELLVMGSDWEGKFDWVSSEVIYLPRTEGISSTQIKMDLESMNKHYVVLFGDTYAKKHYDCALSLINSLTKYNISPIITNNKDIPREINCNAIIYFNKPSQNPPDCYNDIPKILIDHGASHLKWFLANRERFAYFDIILTAGSDHSRSLLTFFHLNEKNSHKVRSTGFIKSNDLLSKSKYSREEICKICHLNPEMPIILFAPTWHISENEDVKNMIASVSKIENHVASLHPDTNNVDLQSLNIVENIQGMTLELMKHASCVISDLSSTIFEAASIGIPTVQVLLREYPDNNAILYDFPYSAGSAELFCGGVTCKPNQILENVQEALSGNLEIKKLYSGIFQRILKGTNISNQATDEIARELRLICMEASRKGAGKFEKRNLESDDRLSAALRDEQKYVENLRIARNRLIAHAGGDYNRQHASNSREAILAAFNALDFVEVDVVQGADGLLIAHDTFEEKYGFKSKFSEVSCDEFSRSKFCEELSTISVHEVIIAAKRKNKVAVFDIKESGEIYEHQASIIHEIAMEEECLRNVVLQAYNKNDFDACCRLGDIQVLLAVWKYFYRDPLGKEAFDFLEYCVENSVDSVVGISVPYQNKHLPRPTIDDYRIQFMKKFWKRVYIHGAPTTQYPNILQMNFGIFADKFDSVYEFQQFPKDFKWNEYLFLYPGLIEHGIVDQVSSVLHYLRYGKDEGRLPGFQLPNDFTVQGYLEKNPGLRKAGVGGAFSAKAHWVRYGQFEGRRYK